MDYIKEFIFMPLQVKHQGYSKTTFFFQKKHIFKKDIPKAKENYYTSISKCHQLWDDKSESYFILLFVYYCVSTGIRVLLCCNKLI